MGRGPSRTWIPWGGLACAVLVAGCLLLEKALTSISNLESRNERVVHTHEVLDKAKSILSELLDAESGIRGYVLTGDEVYLKYFKLAPQLVQSDLRRLKELVGDNPPQEKSVRVLEHAAGVKIDRMNQVVAARRKRGASAIQKLVSSKTGYDAMEEVRAVIKRIVSVENELLVQRTSAAEESDQRSTTIVGLAVLTMTMLVLGAVLVANTLAQSRRKYAELVSSIGDGFYSLDRNLRLIHSNATADLLLEAPTTCALGRPFFDVIPIKQGINEEEQHYREVLRTRVPCVFNSVSKSGIRAIEYRVFPSEEGISVFLHDITERLNAENRIRQLNESLEQRVLDRTAQLDGFCHSIAHDMRMHIRGVSTNAALLIEDIEHGRTNHKERIGRLTQSTHQMASLVNGLLAYARSSTKDVVRCEIDLSAEAGAIARQLREEESYARDVEFRINPNLAANADKQLAGVVIHNLLDNACKYKRAGIQPVVEVGAVEIRGRRMFYVRDNGLGFDQKYSNKIFAPFERLHGDLAVPGSGIGLANTKRILAGCGRTGHS